MRWLRRFAGSGGVALVLSFLTVLARADVKDNCNAAAESAQRLRNGGKLEAARQQMVACASLECPAIVRSDCTKWLAELAAIMPSVVLRAVDASGTDVTDVRVSVDGKPMGDHLDGKEVAIDPGTHVFRFERSGSAPVEQQVLIREAEQHRLVSVTFGPAVPAASARPESASAAPRPTRSVILPVGLLAVGAAGLGVASYFWLSGLNEHSTMASTCASSHNCSLSRVDAAKTDLVVGDVVGGVGVIAAALGTWMLLSDQESSAPPPVSAVVVPGGGRLELYARF